MSAALLAGVSWGREAPATEPYRMVSPSGGPVPRPAVLLVPGCSGFAVLQGVNIYEERAAGLQAAGYSVVFVDYVGRRGLTNCGHVSKAEIASDIVEAAQWTKDQAGIDAGAISVIGWSYGGGGLLAALSTMPPGPPIFAKAVLYYPDCRGLKPWTAARIPALLFMGALDDVARPGLCDTVVKGAPSDRVRTIVYPNAYHAFDVRSLPQRAQYPFGTLGHNPEAAAASWAAMLDFLR